MRADRRALKLTIDAGSAADATPTPPSSSGRSRTCSRTRCATGRPPGLGPRAGERRAASSCASSTAGPGIPLAEQRADLRAVLPRAGAHGSGPRLGARASPSSRGFVEANGGTVAVESLPGQGTSFVVELPISKPAPRPEVTGVSGRRVLVCDDEPQILRALRIVLARRRLRGDPGRDHGGGTRPGGGPPARRGDHRPRPARRRRHRGVPAAARVDADADHRAVRGRRRGARRCARSRPARTTT